MGRSHSARSSAAAAMVLGLGLVLVGAGSASAYSVESWPVGRAPIGVTLSADSSALFVAERGDGGTPAALAEYDTATGALIWRLTLPGEPTAVLASPVDNTHVFVASYNAGAVWEVDTSTTPGTISRTVTGGGGPVALAASPTGDRIFVGTLFNPQWQVDLATFTRTDFSATGGVRGLAVAFDDGHLLATVPGSDLVERFDISGAVPASVNLIPVGDEPWGIATNPLVLGAYVGNTGGPNTVSVLTPTGVTDTIPSGDGLRIVAAYPDGSRVYVAGLNSGLNVIDVAAGTSDSVVEGSATEGVAVAPDGNRVYLASAGDDTVKVFIRPTAGAPGDFTVEAGATVTFAPPIGFDPDGMRWQRSDDGGATWVDIAGETGATYTFSPTAADGGAQFRVVLTSRIFPDTVSPAGTVTIAEPPLPPDLAPSGLDPSLVVPAVLVGAVLVAAGIAVLALARRRRS